MSSEIIFLAGAADKSSLLKELISAGHRIKALVLPTASKYQNSCKAMADFARQHKIETICCKSTELEAKLKTIAIDLLISSGYPFIIPNSVFTRARYAINFHPTLLPKYRGRYLHPILINNDKETGVTAHLIDDNYDTGAIIKQIKYPVETFDTIKSLNRKNILAETKLMLELLNDINQGELKTREQQESDSSSYFEPRRPDDSEINPEKSLKDLFYEIRAYDPDLYPAFFMLNGEKVYIKIYRKNKADNESDMI